jgi:protein O-mannosyl-transferase
MLASRLLVSLAAAFLLWLALPGTFVFDDHSLFVDPAVVPVDAWRQWIKVEQTRPLTYVTFWVDYHLWGANPAGFRFTNLLIHGISSALVFLITRRLFGQIPGLIAALVFALHPLTHEPLLYIFARSGSLAAAFCLLAMSLWLKDKPGLAAGAFAASLLAKEEWVAFPLALLLIDFARGRKPRWFYFAGMLALSAAAGARVIYATKVIAGAGSGLGQQTTPAKYFLSQGQAIPGYLWRIAVPVNLSIDPAIPSESLAFWILFGLAVGVASWYWAKMEQPGFWLLPAFVLLLPSSSILPAADPIAFRRMYLPMALIAIAIALALRKWPKAAMALIVIWAAFAAARRATWASERALWADAVEQAPNKLRPYIQLARVSPKTDALRYLDKAREMAPNDPEVASERGRVWLESGDAAQALSEFGRALALAPRQPRHLQNRGAALLALGQTEAARADFETALQRDPCLKPARENLLRLGVQPPPSTCPTINSVAK